jgi:hypothetical protein
MRLYLPVTVLLLIVAAVSLNTTLPQVKAQSTNITDVSYPAHAKFDLEKRTTDPPLLVKATVSYSDAKLGYFLSVSIFDLDSGDPVKGGGTASPARCYLVGGYASCLMNLRSSSGTEHVELNIAGFKPTMSLAIIAVLFNATGSMIYASESDYEFAIVMTSSLALSIRVPSMVSVQVDGALQPEGNVHLNLIPGPHTISLPATAQLNDTTRLKFEGWSDGVSEPNRTISISHGITLTAIYATQYLLAATSSQGNTTGSGWYNEGFDAMFSVPSTAIPMNGIMGLLGGKWKFQGWYENGKLVTASTGASINMSSSHSLTARWQPDYSLPTLFFTILALAVVLVYGHRNFEAVSSKSRHTHRRRTRRGKN